MLYHFARRNRTPLFRLYFRPWTYGAVWGLFFFNRGWQQRHGLTRQLPDLAYMPYLTYGRRLLHRYAIRERAIVHTICHANFVTSSSWVVVTLQVCPYEWSGQSEVIYFVWIWRLIAFGTQLLYHTKRDLRMTPYMVDRCNGSNWEGK